MKRQIKFRAWDKDNKEMFNVHAIELIDIIEGREGVSAFKGGAWKESRWIEMNDCELMQFTGLHDKNGKEIYEGDIVNGWSFISGVVVYLHDGFKIKISDDNREGDLIPASIEMLEVIGHIYEHSISGNKIKNETKARRQA